MPMDGGVGGAARRRKNAKSREAKYLKQQADQAKMVDDWFETFDRDGNGRLEADELRGLLQAVVPDREPTDQAVEYLIEASNRIKVASMHIKGEENGGVSRHNVQSAVKTFLEYIKHQDYIDRVLAKHDKDGSGTLERDELLAVLLELLPAAEADSEDVDFLLKTCDVDGDEKITRQEVLPLLGVWMEMGPEKAATLGLQKSKRGSRTCERESNSWSYTKSDEAKAELVRRKTVHLKRPSAPACWGSSNRLPVRDVSASATYKPSKDTVEQQQQQAAKGEGPATMGFETSSGPNLTAKSMRGDAGSAMCSIL